MTHAEERTPSSNQVGDAVFAALEREYEVMTRSGVTDGEAWFLGGFTAEEATGFAAYGFSAAEATQWTQAVNTDLRARRGWWAVGVSGALPTLQAVASQLDPVAYTEWRIRGFSHTETVRWAARWDLDAAREWRAAGISDPASAARWRALSFSPQRAAAWETAIRDVAEIAAGPVEIGFTPREASAAAVAGVDRPPELAQRLPGDLTAAVARGSKQLRAWAGTAEPHGLQ